MNPLLQRVSIDPAICHGQPCVKGTRIMVWLIVEMMANGDTLTDVLAALAFSAEMTKERVIPFNVSVAA